MPQLIVIDENKKFLDFTINALANTEWSGFTALNHFPDKVDDLRLPTTPMITVIGPSFIIEKALDLALALREKNPLNAVILLTQRTSTELLKMAMHYGIYEVIEVPCTVDEFQAAIDRAQALIYRLLPSHVKPVEATEITAKVVTLFSAKGGAGKSFLAVNLAASIAALRKKSVVIVDLDLNFGDIAVMLSIFPQRTIFEAAEVIDKLDFEMLEGFLAKTKLDQVMILPAPIEPEQAELIESEAVKKILNLLACMFDYVIIDTPARFNENTFSALDISNLVILVASMDVPCIKNSKIALRVLEELNYDKDRVMLILNRANSNVGLTQKDVSKNLDFEIDGMVPSDRIIPQSINCGVPLVQEFPKSAAAKSLNALTEKLLARIEDKV